MKEETITVAQLNKELQEQGIKIDYLTINKKLFLMHQLSAVSLDIAVELQREFEKLSIYKFQIKHNHREIKRLCVKQTQDFFKAISIDELINFGEDTDSLHDLLYRWVGLKG